MCETQRKIILEFYKVPLGSGRQYCPGLFAKTIIMLVKNGNVNGIENMLV